MYSPFCNNAKFIRKLVIFSTTIELGVGINSGGVERQLEFMKIFEWDSRKKEKQSRKRFG